VSEPLFSVITPVYDPPPEVLERMLASVRNQTFADWEHCIVDDAGPASKVWPLLERAAAEDERVRVERATARGGIVAASNAAVALARGTFLALLDHDDELAPEALAEMAAAIGDDGELDCLYSDEDKLAGSGRTFDPFVKPGWSPDRLRNQMYTGHLSVLRRALVQEVGGFREGYDGSQDWDLVLRASARARRIARVPKVLYHWRTLASSAASEVDAKPWAHDASRRAVGEQLDRDGVRARVEPTPGYPGHYWLAPEKGVDDALVSVVIPTAGRSQAIDGVETPLVLNCVRSVRERSTHTNLEFVVVADRSVSTEVRAALSETAGERLRIVDFDRPFNFSAKINLGVAEARGEYLLLLNDDIEVIPAGWQRRPRRSLHPVPEWPLADAEGRRAWLEAMLVYARQPKVGAVGAKLYFPDGRLQHAGVTVTGGAPGHPYYGAPGNSAGYYNNLIVAGNFLAVTAACLMCRRDAFDAVGGLDEERPVNYNDVDFCLELRERGLRSVLVPWVELIHRESATRGPAPAKQAEIEAMKAKWGALMYADPYYDDRFAGGDFALVGSAAARSYLVRARQLLREGGPGLLARRAAGRLRRRARERLGRSAFGRSRWVPSPLRRLALGRTYASGSLIAAVDDPPSTTVREHNTRVCRFTGWVASTAPRTPVIRVLGLEAPLEFTPTRDRPEVVASLGRAAAGGRAIGFEFYVELPRILDDFLPVWLEFSDGESTVRTDEYRLLRDVDPFAAPTYVGETEAKRGLARRHLAGRGLEFGALHLPLDVDPSRCEMHYADRWSKRQALEMFPELGGEFASRIVEPEVIVDVALDDLSELERHEFDFFVANDVIEHLPNPINFLTNVGRIMKPGAKLFISVPDRDYSFDVMRDLTPYEHLWEEHEAGVSEVTEEHLLEFLAGTGIAIPDDPDQRRKLLDQHQARSIHVHVWNQESFDAFLAETIERLDLGLSIAERLPSRDAGGSMVYVLVKASAG
jgi:GT2 family glycosyltransferase/SAM-dependent methyltransferase